MPTKLAVDFIDNADSQYDQNAARIRYEGDSNGGKLFLGDNSSASFVQLKHRNCKKVVNCCKDLHGFCREADVKYLKIDPDEDSFSTAFEESYQFITTCLDRKENVVVHCENGYTKSAAIVVYFLMKRGSMTSLAESYEAIQNARGKINIRPQLLKVLLDTEKKLFGSNSIMLDGRKVVILTGKHSKDGGGMSPIQRSYIAAADQKSSGVSGFTIGIIVAAFFGALYAVLYTATGKV